MQYMCNQLNLLAHHTDGELTYMYLEFDILQTSEMMYFEKFGHNNYLKAYLSKE